MNKPIFNFPEEGCFIGRNEAVENYLISKKRHSSGNKCEDYESIGIAWNEDSYWYFKMKSGKKVYTYEQLLDDEKHYSYRYVNCKTQQEWDFASEVLGYKWLSKEWKDTGDSSCIDLKQKMACGKDLLISAGTKIYSFEEWCIKFGHKPDFKPHFEVGKWYYATYTNSPHYVKCAGFDSKKFNYDGFIQSERYSTVKGVSQICEMGDIRLADLTEIQQYLPENHVDKICKQDNVQMTKEELLEEAKRRYPVGTVFKCACDDTEWDSAVGEFNIDLDNDISIDSDFDAAYVYYLGKWAEIISKPTEEKWIPKVGDWAVCTYDYPGGIWYEGRVFQIGKITDCGGKKGDSCHPTSDLTSSLLYSAGNFRKALPHEIPNNVKAYTAEEALIEIQKLGLEVGDEIYVRKGNGVISGMETVTELPNMFSNCHRTIIRCSFNSKSELWHSDYPERIADSSIIHKKVNVHLKIGKVNTIDDWEFIAPPKNNTGGLDLRAYSLESLIETESNSNSTIDSILEILDKYIVKQPVVLEEYKPIVLHKLTSLI